MKSVVGQISEPSLEPLHTSPHPVLVLTKSICTHKERIFEKTWIHSFLSHLGRRHSRLQTHRGSAPEEPGRQSWAGIGFLVAFLSLAFEFSDKTNQKNRIFCGLVAMKTSSEMSSWDPRPPSRGLAVLLLSCPCQCSHSTLTHDDQLIFDNSLLFYCFCALY